MEKNNFELGEKKAVNNNEVWGDAKPCGSSQMFAASRPYGIGIVFDNENGVNDDKVWRGENLAEVRKRAVPHFL